MDPIHTECPTCGSRLRLRDESLIGQILPCPKCHGMVLIGGDPDAADPQLQVGHSSDADSQAVTSDAVSSPELAGQPLGEPPVADPIDGATGDLGVPQSWESHQTRRSRQIAAVTALGLATLLASIAIFVIVVRRYQQSQQRVAMEAKADAEGGDKADAEAETEAEQPAEVAPDGAGQNVDGPEEKEAEEGDTAVEGDAEGETLQPDDGQQSTSPPSGALESREGEETADPSASDAAVGGANDAANTSPGESVDGDVGAASGRERTIGAMANDANGGAVGESSDDAAVENLPNELPADLQQFMGFLDLAPATALQPPPMESPQPTLELEGREEEEEESLHPGPAEPIDLARAMKRSLRGISAEDIPFADAIELFSQLAGAPISFDLKTLDAAKIELARPVTIKASGGTVGDGLQQLAADQGCTIEVVENAFPVIRATEESVATSLAKAFAVDDLPPEVAAQLDQVTGWFPNETLKVQPNPLRTALTVQGPADAQFELALVIEALRAELKLPAKLPASQTRRWLNVAEREAPSAGGAVPTSPVRALPTVMLLKQLAEVADKQVVIDWPVAWSQGLTATTTALPLFLTNDPHREAERLLKRFVLRVYPAGDDLWRVTSAEQYDREWVIQTLALPPELTVEQFLEQLRRVASQPDGIEALAIPGREGSVVVRLPRFLARQLAQQAGPQASLTQK